MQWLNVAPFLCLWAGIAKDKGKKFSGASLSKCCKKTSAHPDCMECDIWYFLPIQFGLPVIKSRADKFYSKAARHSALGALRW